MNIDWMVPCRYAEVHDNLGTIVGAGIDTWWFPQLPAPVQVPVALRVVAAPGEVEEASEHTITNIIRGPDGSVVSEMSEQAQIGGQGNPEWLTGLMVLTVVQFEVTAAGTWHFEHRLDESVKTVPLHMVEGPPPGAEPAE